MAAAVVGSIAVFAEDAVGRPQVARERPNALHHVRLGALLRQWQQGGVGGRRDLSREAPASLIAVSGAEGW